MSIKLIKKQKIWNEGYIELWDFSEANSSQENREEACAFVSEVCRGKKIVNPKKHYQRLLTEHNGSPSEILQFIPSCLYNINPLYATDSNNFLRFTYLEKGFIYSNLRATLNSKTNYKNRFSKKKDCKNFIVFKLKIPYLLLMHLVRHKRISSYMAENWQSNRSKHKVGYFYCDELKLIKDYHIGWDWDDTCRDLSLKNIEYYEKEFGIRHELIGKGEMGLRYQTLFFAGWKNDPVVWDNFFGVRTVKPTQKETQELANTMLAMMKKYCDYAE